MVRADDPDGPGLLQNPSAGRQPLSRETIVLDEALELVPAIVDRVYQGLVGPMQLLSELEIVRRIGEDQVRAALRQGIQDLYTVALVDLTAIQLKPHSIAPHRIEGRQ